MTVLVDTSVWIRFLSNKAPYADELDHLLAEGLVFGHDLVFGELLIGDVGGRLKLLEDYEKIGRASMVSHHVVVQFVRERKLHGRGVGWIDIHLLASAKVDGLLLWTADPRFHQVAHEFGIAYQMLG